MIIPIILAAGAGTRMLPLTKVVPKPCVPLINLPLIMYLLRDIKKAGFSRVGINLYHLAEKAQNNIERMCKAIGDLEPVFVVEPYLSGSGGGVRALYNAFDEPDATFLVFNGDTVIRPDIKRFIHQHEQRKARLSILCSPNPLSKSVVVNFRASPSRVLKIRSYGNFSGPGLTACDFTGVQLISGELIAQLPDGPCDIIDTLYAEFIRNGDLIHAVRHKGYWASIESPEILLKVTKDILNNRTDLNIRLPSPFGSPTPVGPRSCFVANPRTMRHCQITDVPCIVGYHVSAEPGSRIASNSVLEGVHLALGSSVKNAVLFNMGLIEGQWHNCVGISGEVVRF